jgi:hypothetical protein
LVGTKKIDESLTTIFDFLEKRGRLPRLVHIPEFVVKALHHPQLFNLTEEHDYNEYVLDAYGMAKLEGSLHRSTRREINHFLKETEGRKLDIRQLDLSSPQAVDKLYATLMRWDHRNPGKNDPMRSENQAIKAALTQARELELEHLALYVDDVLHAFLVYHQPPDKDYYLTNHLRVSHEIPFLFDFMIHHLASQAIQNDIRYLNIEMDLGIDNLRQHKMRLRPVEFFRKYTVTPVKVERPARRPSRRTTAGHAYNR